MESSSEIPRQEIDLNTSEKKLLNNVSNKLFKDKDFLDKQANKINNIRYQPKCALKDNITETLFGSYSGIYEYKPIEESLIEIPDPYNIFPQLETILKNSEQLSNEELTQEVSNFITNTTQIPVVIEEFKDRDSDYSKLDNGNYYFHQKSTSGDYLGVSSKYYSTNNPEKIDFKKPSGDIILINKLKIKEISAIKTMIHELGHIVENNYLLKDNQQNTDVISSLYGAKASLLLSNIDYKKSEDLLYSEVMRYNWILTGTVAS